MKLKITKPAEPTPLQKALAELPFDPESETEYQGLMFVEQLLGRMKDKGLKRKELAKRMGVGPSRVTAMLNGTSNFKMETLVRAAHAVDASIATAIVPEGAKVRWSIYREDDVHAAFSPDSSTKKVFSRFTLGTDEIAQHDDGAAA